MNFPQLLAALAQSGINLHGIDHSPLMIAQARTKESTVNWYVADIEYLPFKNRTVNGVLCTLAVHHFRDIAAAFKEVFRVLIGGRFVIFTSTTEQMKGYWLNEYFPEAMARSSAQILPVNIC